MFSGYNPHDPYDHGSHLIEDIDLNVIAVSRTLSGKWILGFCGDDRPIEGTLSDDQLWPKVIQIVNEQHNGDGLYHCIVSVEIYEDVDGKEITQIVENFCRSGAVTVCSLDFVTAPLMVGYSFGRTTFVAIYVSTQFISIFAVVDSFEIGEMSRRVHHSFFHQDGAFLENLVERRKAAQMIAKLLLDSLSSAPLDSKKFLKTSVMFSLSEDEPEGVSSTMLSDLQEVLQEPSIRLVDASGGLWIGISILGSLSSYKAKLMPTILPRCEDDWNAVLKNGPVTSRIPAERRAILLRNIRWKLVLPDIAYHARLSRTEATKLMSHANLCLRRVLPDSIVREIFFLLIGLFGKDLPLGSQRVSAGEAERRKLRHLPLGMCLSRSSFKDVAATYSSSTADSIHHTTADEIAWRGKQCACIEEIRVIQQRSNVYPYSLHSLIQSDTT